MVFGAQRDRDRPAYQSEYWAGHSAAHDDSAPGSPAWETARRRALLLSDVAAEGPVELLRVLRRAVSGDPDAAGTGVAALVRALPGIGAFDCHEVLVQARIRPTELAGEMTTRQRVALVEVLDDMHRLYQPHSPTALTS